MGSGRGGRFGFFLRGRRLRAGTRRLAGAWARRLAVRDRRQTFWLRVTQRLGLAHCGMLALGTHPGPRGLSALAVEPTTIAVLLWRPLLCDTGLLTLSLQHHTDLPIVHLTFKLCLWKVTNLINRFVVSNKVGLWVNLIMKLQDLHLVFRQEVFVVLVLNGSPNVGIN